MKRSDALTRACGDGFGYCNCRHRWRGALRVDVLEEQCKELRQPWGDLHGSLSHRRRSCPASRLQSYYMVTEDSEHGKSTMLAYFSAVRGPSGPHAQEYRRPHLRRLANCVNSQLTSAKNSSLLQGVR